MNKTIVILIIIIFTVSCHRYGNFSLKKEISKGNYNINIENKLDFDAVYVGNYFNEKDNTNLYRFMRFFPNGRMYIEYSFSEITIIENEYFNTINKTNDYRKGQKTYYVLLDSNTIKFEFFEDKEMGYYFHYANIKGDSLSIYKTVSQSLIKKTYEFNKNNLFYYIKKKVDLKPVEVDW